MQPIYCPFHLKCVILELVNDSSGSRSACAPLALDFGGARALAPSTISAKLKSETAELRRAAAGTKKAATRVEHTKHKLKLFSLIRPHSRRALSQRAHSAPFQIVRTALPLGSARCLGKCDVVRRLIASTAASEFGTCTRRHYNYQQYAQSHIVFIIRYIRRCFILGLASRSLHRRRRADAPEVDSSEANNLRIVANVRRRMLAKVKTQ